MKLLIASAAVLFLAAPATIATAQVTPAATSEEAPSASHLALARQYVALVRPGGNSLEEMRDGIMGGALASLGENPSDADIEAAKLQVAAVIARFEPILTKRQPQINEAYARAYAREFTADELRGLIDFISSPLGRKYHTAVDAVEYDDAVLEAEEAMAEEMAPIAEELRKTACAERAKQRVAMGDANAKCPLSQAEETAAG